MWSGRSFGKSKETMAAGSTADVQQAAQALQSNLANWSNC